MNNWNLFDLYKQKTKQLTDKLYVQLHTLYTNTFRRKHKKMMYFLTVSRTYDNSSIERLYVTTRFKEQPYNLSWRNSVASQFELNLFSLQYHLYLTSTEGSPEQHHTTSKMYNRECLWRNLRLLWEQHYRTRGRCEALQQICRYLKLYLGAYKLRAPLKEIANQQPWRWRICNSIKFPPGE